MTDRQHTIGPNASAQTEGIYDVDASPQYEELTTKYEQMRQQVKHYRDAHTILSEKYRRNKDVWKQWVEQDRLRREKAEKKKAQLTTIRTDLPVTPVKEKGGTATSELTPNVRPSTMPQPNIAPEAQWNSSPPSIRNIMHEPDVSTGDIERMAPNVEIAELATKGAENHGSEHTTDAEGETHGGGVSPVSRSLLYDGERSVSPPLPHKSKKVKAEKMTQALDDIPIYIKSEPRSSDSVLDHFAFTQQSLDLDDIGHKPETPRKRRYMGKYRQVDPQQRIQQSNVTPTSLGKRFDRILPRQEQELEDEDHEAQPDYDTTLMPENPFAIPTLLAPQFSGVKFRGIQEDSQDALLPAPSPTKRQTTISGYFEGSRAQAEKTRINTSNADNLPIPTTITQKQKPKHTTVTPARQTTNNFSVHLTGQPYRVRKPIDHRCLDLGIGFVTEDGTNGIETPAGSLPMVHTAERKGILGELLGTPPAKVPSITHLRKDMGSVAVTPIRTSAENRDGSDFITPTTVQGYNSKRKIPVTDPPVSKRSKFSTASERKPPRDMAGREGLRSRKAKELNIADFAVNADKTGGVNYAYQEVIRKRDERKCLPGCLGSCCKELRDFLAKAGMPPVVPSKVPKWRSSPPLPGSSQLEPEDGEGSEAEEVVGEDLKQFVNKYAKHRNLFDRQDSPPGFWEADFPDTQDLEQRRKAARKEERSRVGEMKKDAAKGGGRWVFRDEV